jgi:hypothetical protein
VLISRAELRMALTAGLGNAFASLSGLPFGYYVPLAVLAVGVGSYGGSLAMGRQRILGSVLGAALLVVGCEGLAGLPMPLGLAITLAALRLLGGLLGLQTGYKVGGFIVVMGWLVHDRQLASWIGLRLGWTCFGVVLALLSLRLFWPSQSLALLLRDFDALLEDLQALFGALADRVDPLDGIAAQADPTSANRLDASRYQALRGRLLALRRLRPALEEELGGSPRRHPTYRLIEAFDRASSRLVHAAGAMLRRPPPLGDPSLAADLQRAEADLLRCLVTRLGRWRLLLAQRQGVLPLAPSEPFPLPESWRQLEQAVQDPSCDTASLECLERLAARLMLCRLAQGEMVEAERQWSALQASGRAAHQRSIR